MSSNQTLFPMSEHPELYLPVDPFPFAFEEEGLKATLKDLLKVVRRHPAYFETTHAATHRLFIREGLDSTRSDDVLRFTGKEVPAYLSCSNFFGVEESIHEVVNDYYGQARMGGRARRKALAITGSPGSGKSDFVNLLTRDILRKREPIPMLAGSPMGNSPLSALFLPNLIAAKKCRNRSAAQHAELVRIIESLDFNGEAELNFDNPDMHKIVQKHGFDAGQELSSEDLAKICAANAKDFVHVVCYGLDLPKSTVDSVVEPDPWSQDVVLGEFFGPGLIDPMILEDAGLAEKFAGKRGKAKSDDKYGRFDADYAVDLCDFPIDNIHMSRGEGIVDVAEVQPINFDLKVWRGDENIGTIGMYDDRDPRTVSLNGFFNKGKFIVLTEGFRNPSEGFRVLLEALEGQRLPLPEPLAAHHPDGVRWEGSVLIHSNDEQWNKFFSDPAHRAHNDRLHWVSWRYPLEPKQSARVNTKLYNSSAYGRSSDDGGVHLEPLIEAYTGMFRVFTHIDWDSKGGLPVMSVLNAFNGETVRQTGMGTEIDVRALRQDAPWTEGLPGMSPREMDSHIGTLAATALDEYNRGLRSSAGFTVAELRDHLILKFRKDPRIDKKDKERWIGFLEGDLETKFRRVELSRVYKAAFIPNFADLSQKFFRKYLEYIKAINQGIPRSGLAGGQIRTEQQMQQFLQEIESADSIRVNTAQADKFRQNVLVAVDAYKDEHGVPEPPYTCHEGLRRCIESYVLRQGKDITGVVGLTSLSKEERERLDSAKQRLIEEHGYDSYTAEQLLLEVATTRDFLVA